jgi:hypothetical protein
LKCTAKPLKEFQLKFSTLLVCKITQNEEEYIKGMKEKCKELSLVIYCTKMINTRITDDDKHAMIKLTQAFGESFWEYSVFVLTFANFEKCERKDDRDEDTGPEPDYDDEEGWKALIKQRFEGRLKIWEKELRSFLVTEVGVSSEIAEGIPVVPTGDHKKTRKVKNPYILPDRDDWFKNFWETCSLSVKDTRLFLKINRSRLTTTDGTPMESAAESDKVFYFNVICTCYHQLLG